MVQKISDKQKEVIVDRYKQGLERKAIAAGTGVPIGSVNRIIAQYRKSINPKTIATEAQTAIAQVVTQNLRPESAKEGHADMDGSLMVILNAMVSSMGKVDPKSSEGCASTAIRAIALYRQFHPQTMEELADQLLALPDFDPGRFVQILRQRIERGQS